MKVIALVTTTTAAALLATLVDAHGGMVDPAPRALTTMGLSIDSTFGHPIPMRAAYTKGKGGNCLDFTTDSKLKPLGTGKSKIKMRANAGANHVGPCTVYLVDPRDKTKKVEVGKMKDCMRSLNPGPGNNNSPTIPAEMTIDIPSDESKLPCDNGHCVLEFFWEATHITPYELYNNCADVKVGGGGGSNPAPAPTTQPNPAPQPTPTQAPKSQQTLAPQPVPQPIPTPTSGPTPAPKLTTTPVPAPAAPSKGMCKRQD